MEVLATICRCFAKLGAENHILEQNGAKKVQNGAKMGSEATKIEPKGAKRSQNGTRMVPKASQRATKMHPIIDVRKRLDF